MAEISSKDIAKKGFLDPAKKQARELKEEIDNLNKSLEESLELQMEIIKQGKKKTSAKGIKEQAENFKKVDNAVKTLNQTREISLAIDKQILAEEKKLKIANSDKIQQKEELAILTKKQNAANKDEAVLTSKLTGTIEKLTASTRKLKRERNALNLETQEGVDRLREINNQIDENDARIKENVSSLEKQKIEVGGYKNAINEALAENELFNDALGNLNGAGKLAVDLFNKMAGTFEDVEDAEEGAASGAKKFGNALKSAGLAALIALVSSLGAAFTATREGTLKFDRAVGAFNASLSTLVGSLSNVGMGLIGFGQAVATALGGNFSDASNQATAALNKLTTSFDGFGKRVKENVKNNDELILSTFKYLDITRRLEREIANLQAREELQQAIADDATKSFVEREKAIRRSIDLSELRLQKQEELAAEEIQQANERLRIELKNAGIIEDLNDKQITDLINNEELRLKVSEESLEQQQEAILQLIEVQNELLLLQKEQDKVVAELKQDRLEKDLDILIDGFDNVKAINEQILADDSKTLEERAKILAQTVRLGQESFNKQAETIQQFTDKAIDFTDLLQEKDAEALDQKIRALGLSEIIEGRLLEVIRERRVVTQDLAVAEKELTEAFKDRAFAQAEITQAIDNELKAGELARAKREGNLEEEFRLRKQILIDNAFFETELVAETADERLLIAEKLKNDLAALADEEVAVVEAKNQKILESEKKLEQDRFELAQTRIDTAKNVADIIGIIGDEDSEAQKRLQQAIAISEININAQREISKIREEYADNDALRRNKILQARTAQFAGVAQVLSAFDGVDDTGGRGNVDSKGGKTWTLHPHEQVHSLKDRKDMADPITGKLRNREEIKNLVNLADNLMLSPHVFKSLDAGQLVSGKDINSAMFAKGIKEQTKELKKAFKEGQTTYNVAWNKYGEVVSEEIKNGITKRFRHKKSRL